MTLDEQIKCVGREIGMRKNVYPRWVANGKMTQAKADHEIAAMEATLETLKQFGELEERLREIKSNAEDRPL